MTLILTLTLIALFYYGAESVFWKAMEAAGYTEADL